jgi:hypothetical protein
MHHLLVTWTLLIMSLAQPVRPSWSDTYERQAEADVTAAERAPLYKGDLAVPKTVALMVSLAWFESSFKPDAKGDHGASWGLFQVAPSTGQVFVARAHERAAAWGDVLNPWSGAKDELLDVDRAAFLALEVMRESFIACRRRPADEVLGWYAAGGEGCRGIKESRARVHKAQWLLRQAPPPVAPTSDIVVASR